MAKAKTNDLTAWASDIDTDATRALIAELQTEGKPWDNLESDPKKYITNYRRICPKRPEWQNPYQVVPVHYLGPNRRMTICLKESGLGECPACNLRWQLQDGGDEQGARGLRPGIRTFLNVVKIDQEGNIAEDKVFLLGLNQIQFLGKRAVEYDPDEEGDLPLFFFFEKYGDLSHVETGRDLLIKAKQDKSGDFDVLALKFSVADPSPFPGTSELLEEGLINLQEVVPIIPADEMAAIIEGRATGALVLPSGGAPAQLAAPAAVEAAPAAAPKSRFGGAEEETATEAPAEEPAAEVVDAPPQADVKVPKTDPKKALQRLRESQAE